MKGFDEFKYMQFAGCAYTLGLPRQWLLVANRRISLNILEINPGDISVKMHMC